jgi:ribosomal protein S10
MQTSQLAIFGKDSSTVRGVVNEIRDICEKSGIEYKGPHTRPTIDLDERDVDLSDSGVQLFGEEPTDGEIEELEGKVVYSQLFKIHRYASDSVLKQIVKREYPDGVFLRVKVDQSDFIGADQGNVPAGYDPNADHIPE